MVTPWIERLLAGPTSAVSCETVTTWWPRHRALCAERSHSTIEQAIVGGYEADRVAWAFATAYQAALRALVPTLPADALVALCVTEEGGTSPSAMRSELSVGDAGLVLDGAKRWTTLGPEGGMFLVAARDTRLTGDRPALRLALVAANAEGVHVETMPPTPFVPEVAHARLRFENVRVNEDALLPGDGYARYVKPFRTIEDLHVHAAVLAYLVREARRLGWPQKWVTRAIATLVTFTAIAGLDPVSSATHVALAGAMSMGEDLAGEADALWAAATVDPEAAARWRRDRALLRLASQPRAARLERAWERLGAPIAGDRQTSV